MICRKKFRWFASIVSLLLIVPFTATAQIIDAPQRTRGTVASPVAGSQHDLVSLTGPGCFVSGLIHVEPTPAEFLDISLQLLIDGRTVVDTTFGEARAFGLEWASSTIPATNFYGLKVVNLAGSINLSIGFPQTLFFEESLILRTILPATGSFTQINGQVIAGVCRESGRGGPKK